MALSQHDLLRLLESLRSADGLELVRSVAERMLQELIEAEATARIGAEWNEHTDARTALRNGHREKTLTTQAGDLGLGIPKLRSGSFFPVLLERRRRIDQALFAVVMEAYVHGVSTRSVDDLVKALGSDTGISKSEISRICQDLDVQLSAFSASDGWTTSASPTSTSTRPTARPGSSTRSSPAPWSSPPASPRTAAAKCSA